MNKKFKIIKYLTACSLLIATFANSQERETKKAATDFNSYAYVDAIGSYEDLVEKGYTSEEIFKNLGNANYQNANYKAASEWYAKLVQLEGLDVETEYLYKYAQTLKSLGKYKESDQWMRKFEATKANDNRALKFADNKDYLNKIARNSGRYDIVTLSINSSMSDFAPSFKGKELVFSSARDTGRISRNIHKWNNQYFLNLYQAIPSENGDFIIAAKFSKALNKKTHESSTAFSKDGATVYFTRNNSKNGKFARDNKGLSRLKLYRATFKEGKWVNIYELPFNDDSYSVAHPALSADETKLYFASDMPGSIGQSDIFVVDINSDGSFGTPKNLGEKINTEGRETFPFLTEGNVLYFASDGQPGLGGLDVFVTLLDELDYTPIINIGEPVNSKQDDFSFIIDEATKKGFFASNREGGLGSDDIYGFTETKEIDLSCKSLVAGIIRDRDNGQPLSAAKLVIIDSKNQKVATAVSKTNGTFVLEGDCRDGDYKLMVSKEEYNDGDTMFSVLTSTDTSGIEIALEKTVKKAAVGTELIKYLGLSPVHFDLNESKIRPDAKMTLQKIVEYMKLFPDCKVEVQAHTDAKAGNEYNRRLSERRAKATVAYLFAKGIDGKRITGRGFGETRLANDCTSREKCEDSKHQINRRSEFIVIE